MTGKKQTSKKQTGKEKTKKEKTKESQTGISSAGQHPAADGRIEKKARRRFIAGAVCPQCGEMDRLVVEPAPVILQGNVADGGVEAGNAADTDYRRCVDCGYTDVRPSIGITAPRSRLEGGLKRPAQDPETPTDRVRIIDPRSA